MSWVLTARQPTSTCSRAPRACFSTSAMATGQPPPGWVDGVSKLPVFLFCLICALHLIFARGQAAHGLTGADRSRGLGAPCTPGDKFMGEECDRNALVYFAERLESWGIAAPWPVYNETSFPCDTRGAVADVLLGHPSLTWLGVHCKLQYPGVIEQPGPDWDGAYRVSSVDLRSSNIAGPVSELLCALANLTELESLLLSKNAGLVGQLPDCTLRFTNLTSFIMDSAQVQGTLPSAFAALTKLTTIDFTTNQLTGTLPSELSLLTDMHTLRLGMNNFVGTLPPVWHKMSSLVDIRLSNNPGLGGELPSEYGNWRELRHAWMDACNFTGPLPATWGSWSKLEQLYLLGNALTGTLPESWSNLGSVNRLHLGDNYLRGELPASWGERLQSLEMINMMNNALSGTIPTSWGQLARLERMTLANNQLSAAGGALGGNSEWMAPDLNLSWAPGGKFSPHWWFPMRQPKMSILLRNVTATTAVLPKLKQLDLGNNPLNAKVDDVMRSLCSLQSLATLQLYNAGLYGALGEGLNYYEYKVDRPVRHFGFSALGALDLSGNYISELYDFLPAAVLIVNLMNNNITGDMLKWTGGLNTPVPVVAIQNNPQPKLPIALPNFLEVDLTTQDAYPKRNLVCRKVKGKNVALSYTLDPWYDGYARCVCQKGYGSENGLGTCTPCPPDTYRLDSWDQPNCTACPPHTHTRMDMGFATEGSGADSLESCLPEPGFQPVLDPVRLKFLTAEACVDGTTKALEGHRPCSPCEYGQYAYNSTTCLPCPENAVCDDSIFNVPVNRWRRSSEETTLYKCVPNRCEGEEVPYNGEGCALGHRGPLCSMCTHDHAMAGRKCQDCNKVSVWRDMVALMFLATLFVCLFLSFTCWPFLKIKTRIGLRAPNRSAHDPLNTEDDKVKSVSMEADATNVVVEAQLAHKTAPANAAVARESAGYHGSVMEQMYIFQLFKRLLEQSGIQAEVTGMLQQLQEKGFTLVSIAVEALAQMVSYLQIMSTFTTIYDIPWPKILIPLFDIISGYFVLRLTSVPSLGCMVRDVTFYTGWTLWMFTPLAVFSAMKLMCCWASVCMPRKDVQVFKNCMCKTVLLALFLMYIPLAYTVTSMFVCTDLYGVQYLTVALHERCWTSRHNVYVILASVFMLIYPIGIPYLYYLALKRLKLPEVVEEKLTRNLFYKIVMNYTTRASGGLPGNPETTRYVHEDVQRVYNSIMVDKSALHAISRAGSHAIKQRSTTFSHPPLSCTSMQAVSIAPDAYHPMMSTMNSMEAAQPSASTYTQQVYLPRNIPSDISEYRAVWPQQESAYINPQIELVQTDNASSERTNNILEETVEYRSGQGMAPAEPYATSAADDLTIYRVPVVAGLNESVDQVTVTDYGAREGDMSTKEMMCKLLEFVRVHQPHLLKDMHISWSLSHGIPKEELEIFQKHEKCALLNSSFIFAAYKPQFWWWECVECARKFVLTCAMLFISPGTANQIISGILINAAMVCIYLIYLPMGSHLTLYLKVGISMLTCYDLFVGLGYSLKVMDTDPPGWAYSVVALNIIAFGIPVVFALCAVSYTVYRELRARRRMAQNHGRAYTEDAYYFSEDLDMCGYYSSDIEDEEPMRAM